MPDRSFAFSLAPDVFALYPDVRVALVVAHGIDNTRSADAARALLLDAAQSAADRIGDSTISEHPAVAPWRNAYRAFGVKPSKFRSSIEGLLRTAIAGQTRSINPLVDLYNTTSLTHMLPCGGEDLGQIDGPIRLTRATGGEHLVPLGATMPDPPQPGEVIYRDDVGVICRCFNWHEADRTKLTQQTTSAVLVIEAVPPVEMAQLLAARDELAARVTEHLGGTTMTYLLDGDHPSTNR